MNLIKTIFGTKNERDLKRMQPLVEQINEFEKSYQSLTDDQLKGKTVEFKERVAQGESLTICCARLCCRQNACRRLCGTSRGVRT